MNALCNWNRCDDLIDLISDSLNDCFKSGSMSTAKVINLCFYTRVKLEVYCNKKNVCTFVNNA